MTLYVLGAGNRVALLRLPNIDEVTRAWNRSQLLRHRWSRGDGTINGVAFNDIVVLGVSGASGEVYEYEAAERLVEGEDVASDQLARPPKQDVSAFSDWFKPPADWADRLRAPDVAVTLYAVSPSLAELRDRGDLLRPSDEPRGAYERLQAMIPEPSPWHRGRRTFDPKTDPHGAETAKYTDEQWANALVAASYGPPDKPSK